MRFSLKPLAGSRPLTLRMKLGLFFLFWLVLISWLHYRLNYRQVSQKVVRMGYMPVVTNVAAPLLDYVTRHGAGVHFEAVKFSSFAEMAEALRNDSIQAAFIIAPLAVVLRQQGVDVKVVLIGSRHESTLVARKTLNAKRLEDLSGRTIAVPMRYSGHNLCLLKMIEEKGLGGKIRVVEMNPPDMASALTSGALDAYFVGEPFAAQTVLSDDADVVAYVESLWPNFICNLVLVKNSWIDADPSVARKLAEMAARSGLWAGRHPDEAARIVSGYWNQSVELVRYALTTPKGRVVYDRFIPKTAEIQTLADLMVRYNLARQADITGLVDDRFALAASVDGIDDLDSIVLSK
ncbi:ABC transporter substrate-binding protein [uncultured Desulfosarcina sp.]|uniref:ABC transporter substrate-binding protein n=1 Tax=uncultured Desulfosarcina sp. TaxID=218289 RepID=UPI0029C6951C|nr:ABC transporter substrate-binding protein [uncultured Desulfosarcina sp.]